jgi:hypothetical protein
MTYAESILFRLPERLKTEHFVQDVHVPDDRLTMDQSAHRYPASFYSLLGRPEAWFCTLTVS